jgi:poly(beta-D-mannuronate) lyase
VKENIVLGQGVDGAHGLRMSGRDNLVQGNFVAGCDYGIRVACGEFIADSLTAGYTPDVKPNGRKTAQVRIPTYPQVVRLSLSDNAVVGSSGPDLEIGSDYKKHWPESQQVLLPEDCLIKNNRFVRPHGGASVLVTTADSNPPLNRFQFKSNHCVGNVVVGEKTTSPAAPEGFVSQALPADWSEAHERSSLKPLTAKEVGPTWVIALREAGRFPMEAAASSERTTTPEPRKKNKAR